MVRQSLKSRTGALKPGFKPGGEMTTRNLLGPEFQLQTDSIIANTANFNGSGSVHYDKALAYSSGFVVTSWNEL